MREFTKGVPGLNDNNHPIRYGRVVGVHNGHLDNDDELFARFGRPRSTPDITVDSEAIMMLTDLLGDLGEALELVQGAATAAVLRDGEPVPDLARPARHAPAVRRPRAMAWSRSPRPSPRSAS